MNKELIKKYRAEFNHWIDGGTLQIIFLDDTEPSWKESPDSEVNFILENVKNLNIQMVINDEYVEFRKALAEGKIVQYEYVNSTILLTEWRKFDNIMNFNPNFKYRIKPEESEFTYPMWFCSSISGLIYKFDCFDEGIRIDNTSYTSIIPHTNTKVWTQVPEPNKMIKVAKYRFFDGRRYTTTSCYYKHNEDFKSIHFSIKYFERLEEIEVEDY